MKDKQNPTDATGQPSTANDCYAELQRATPEQLLEATCNFYKNCHPSVETWIKLGFKLTQRDGWKQVAPSWLSA